MIEISEAEIQTKAMDHHGLVAALCQDLKIEDITDHTLACALDDIAEYGASKLFAEVAFEIALENNLLDLTNHIDTASMLVHGVYAVDDNPKIVEVAHGFSKDHRPDTKENHLRVWSHGYSNLWPNSKNMP